MPDDTPDGHPGAILVGRPLDGTRLPKSAVGMALSDVTGIVTYQVSDWFILARTYFLITLMVILCSSATTTSSRSQHPLFFLLPNLLQLLQRFHRVHIPAR